MEESIEESGRTRTCMELEATNGLMDVCLQVSMTMIRNTDMESTPGQMTENTEDGGRRGNRMVLASMSFMRK